MKRGRKRALGFLLLPLASFAARAQDTGTPPSTVYRLGEGSSYEQGCFDPCDCPLREPLRCC